MNYSLPHRIFTRSLSLALLALCFPISVFAGSNTPQAFLSSLSARAIIRGGDNVLIGGFEVRGPESKTVVLRAIGPSLADHGVPVGLCLADPTLGFFEQGNSNPVVTNDDWRDGPSTQSLIDLNQQPSNDLESGLYGALHPGLYTGVVSGKNGGSGLGLVQIIDIAGAANGLLSVLSARGVVEGGDNVLIGGFIITTGQTPAAELRVFVRAIGPSLAQYNVPNPVLDPTIDLYDGNGTLLSSNDDWRQGPFVEIQRANLAPADDREAVIMSSLPAGNYTAIVRGKNQASGIALVEIYDGSVRP